jgi:hypothetical protein
MVRQCWSRSISDEFLFENKTRQAPRWSYHLPKPYVSISKYKPSIYACLWPYEFCQIVLTLGRNFSCFHDRVRAHPHIHANSYTGSYEKHAIHPPKISTPSSKDISLLAKEERGHWKKRKIKCSKKHKKCAPIKEHRKKYMKHDPTQIFYTLAHLDQVARLVSSWIRFLAQQHYVAQVSLMLILPKAPHISHRVGSWGSFKSLWWANKHHLSDRGNHLRNFLSLCKNFQKLWDRSQKREEWVIQSQNHSTLQPPKARWKVTSPTSKKGKVSLVPILSK